MKRIFHLVIAIFFIFSGCHHVSDEALKLEKPSVSKQANGMELFVLEDHELPTVQLILYIEGGSLDDPSGKEGLASIATQVIRLGGTQSKTPDEIEETLEFAGASLELGASQEYCTASLGLLKKDLDLGLNLLFDLLRNPALDPGRFELIKAKAKEALLREREDPWTLARREFPKLVYGEKSIWGRQPTAESIDRITLEDVKKFQETFLHPNRIHIATAGDFSAKEMQQKIEGLTHDWQALKEQRPVLEKVDKRFEQKKRVIPRPDLTQSTIVMGHLGEKRDNPDRFPLLVMNFILGGSGALTSRMGEEIRSAEGKAYEVGSDFGFGKDYGLFRAVAQTANENTEWVMNKMEEMIGQMHERPSFTNDELAKAKSAILRSLLFDYETRFDQVKEEARYRLLGYPPNYIEIFQKEIAKVTKEDLGRVARQYLHPEALEILLITSEEEAKKFQGKFETKKID